MNKNMSIFCSVKTYTITLLLCLVFATKIYANELPNFVDLVENNSKAVVNINTKKNIQRLPNQFQGIPEEFLRFFGVPPQDNNNPNEIPDTPISQTLSLGSGFIIDQDGYIITNYHVIRGADEVFVRLHDRRQIQAKIIGFDERSDIALLKIETSGLQAVKIGNSEKLRVGEWVLAIGEPFGLEYTATKGIVSAKKRSLPDDPYVSFIQTDVPINPGNSGGPLFDMKGEVVGINAQIYSNSGGSMGLSFAIPIENAMYVVNQIKKTGKVTRGVLGVQIQEVSHELAQSFSMRIPRGALVAQVFAGTAAEKAKIKEGDIIIEFDGKLIDKSADLPPIVGITPVGQNVAIKIIREGKEITLKAVVTSPNQTVASSKNDETLAQVDKIGVQVRTLNKEEQSQLKISGVVVTDILNKDLYKYGLRKGDIITSFNFKHITTASDLKKVAKNLTKGSRVPMKIVRGNLSTFLSIIIQ